MNYQKEAIEKRNHIAKVVREIVKRTLYIVLIVILYNAFLITKSSLDNNASKEMFGYKSYIIITESMKPSIKVGDVIIVEKCAEEKLKVGDVITLKNEEGSIITHRIVNIERDEQTNERQYTTKGDNNNVEDPENITYKQIEGRKVLVIPLFGKLLLSLSNKMYIIIFLLIIGVIVLHTINVQKKKKLRREKRRNAEAKFKEEEENMDIID